MREVRANERTVNQLLNGVKYTIDFYQREYEWERRNVAELLDDLTDMFLLQHSPHDERAEVQNYPRYFLGTIITSNENNRNYIVDGQQRLTTLTLLLIYINHLIKEDTLSFKDVKPLIFSYGYGTKSFNINVPSRMKCLDGLYEAGEFDTSNSDDVSVSNLVQRYGDIKELFPDLLPRNALPYFVDWLTGNVELVEIVAYTDDDAFTIFETMNDRGVNLGQVDMLKGFLLANIRHAREKRNWASEKWNSNIAKLRVIDSKEGDDFFVAWLRAKYADTTRVRGNRSTTNDFAGIKQFHRWVRDHKDLIGLNDTQDYYDFITQEFESFVDSYVTMRKASMEYDPNLKEVLFNSRLIKMQYMLAFSPLKYADTRETVNEKIRLVTVFLDIYMARRMVNQRGLATLHWKRLSLD